MTLRILTVAAGPPADTEDTLFLRDVLQELEGATYWRQWTEIAPRFAATLEEAESHLNEEPVDAILLDAEAADGEGARRFRRLQKSSAHVPVILLVDRTGIPAAERLLREGAQDFLIKKELDCVPLARAISAAMGRHRVLAAARATSMADPLTGLLSRNAFVLMAERDRMLAQRLGRRMIMMVTGLGGLEEIAETSGDQCRSLELVSLADYLRSLAGPADLTARIGETDFALTAFETDDESAEDIWARLHRATVERRVALGAAVFDPQNPLSLEQLLERAAADLVPRGARA